MEKMTARILIVDDDADVLMAARVVLRQTFTEVETERDPRKLQFLMTQRQYDVVLLDMNYSSGKTGGQEGLTLLRQILDINPDQQVIAITAYADIGVAVEAMKQGAADFVVKPWDNEKLEATVYAAFQHSLSRKEVKQLKQKQSQLSSLVNAAESELIGSSPEMKAVLGTIQKVAQTDANVLILGENGTGKELVARYIHNLSPRKTYPFIKVDVGSLAQNLFESELFGHKKGAFTDAREDRIGRIELAHNGTLFLDEIGNLPAGLQVKLLSVLQNREVTPLGGNTPVAVNLRLISATNLDIHDAVRSGGFREDLLYRINTVEINLPPLRARTEDIPILADHFLMQYSARYRKGPRTIPANTMAYLKKYPWPGNVRELQHAIERAVIMADGSALQRSDFLLSGKASENKEVLSLDEMEQKTIVAAIAKHHGNMSKVAKELGVGRTTLYRKLARYGLENKR